VERDRDWRTRDLGHMYSGEVVDRVRRDRVRAMRREYEDGDDGEGCGRCVVL
jgi:hypothetical protein